MTAPHPAAARVDRPVPRDTTAVVLTHLRPRLAGDVVRSLLDVEGLPPDRVIVVVNGEGGLDDPALEEQVRMARLPRNIGPAGGFRAGLTLAFADPDTRWAYLCEDDVGLIELPGPRVAALVGRTEELQAGPRRVGAVVAYGSRFVGRGAHTVNSVPAGAGSGFIPVDVAAWGATLVSREVVDAGVLPDPDWFFGLEDFDFFCRLRQAGFELLVDADTARAVAHSQTGGGRLDAFRAHRPTDRDEVWRAYYHARNSVELTRRHGRPSWHLWYLLYTARQLQRATGADHRLAIAHGAWDGARGRLGENPRYTRRVGEYAPGGECGPSGSDPAPDRDRS